MRSQSAHRHSAHWLFVVAWGCFLCRFSDSRLYILICQTQLCCFVAFGHRRLSSAPFTLFLLLHALLCSPSRYFLLKQIWITCVTQRSFCFGRIQANAIFSVLIFTFVMLITFATVKLSAFLRDLHVFWLLLSHTYMNMYVIHMCICM